MDDREFRGRVRRLQSAIDRELQRRKVEGRTHNRYIDPMDFDDDIIEAEWVEEIDLMQEAKENSLKLKSLQNKVLMLVVSALGIGIALGSLV